MEEIKTDEEYQTSKNKKTQPRCLGLAKHRGREPAEGEKEKKAPGDILVLLEGVTF